MNEENNKENHSKIYLLPNLMTAGNLFCGFMAILQIIEGTLRQTTGDVGWESRYMASILFILGAFIFDMLDGRVARLGGHESPFGREFDSLADIISFGFAPALLVFKIVLAEFPNRIGWLIAFFYLACGALRLARFNVAAIQGKSSTQDFTGFPIPAAAGVIASITLTLLYLYETEQQIGNWKYLLPVLMVFLSFMMFSKVSYPSFKVVNWRTERSLPRFLGIILLIILIALYWQWMLTIVFLSYLLYGFFRPFLSKKLQQEIEED